jgi:hypothetical protein
LHSIWINRTAYHIQGLQEQATEQLCKLMQQICNKIGFKY